MAQSLADVVVIRVTQKLRRVAVSLTESQIEKFWRTWLIGVSIRSGPCPGRSLTLAILLRLRKKRRNKVRLSLRS